MTVPALQYGNFVWCAFPEWETPLCPGPLHVACTTSQSWAGVLPQGLIAFTSTEAAALGQGRAFVLDLRQLAYLPLTAAWFPRIAEPGAGVLGRAPKPLRDRVNAIATELVKRRPETLSRSGPLW